MLSQTISSRGNALADQLVVAELLPGVGLDARLGDPNDLERGRGRQAAPVLFLGVEKRVRDKDGNLVAHLGRDDGVGEDQDVGQGRRNAIGLTR